MLDKGQNAAAAGAVLSEERLGRYELIARIADGGMAEVFLARQLGPMNFQKVVVVKKIHQNLARQKEFIGMLLDEARISALIKHPRVVDIYDLGVSRGTYFIAMEYLAGQPLSEVIDRGRAQSPLDVYSTARIIADAAEGLHAAHNLKTLAGRALELVHRDVSPANIIVLYDAGVKLVDFGVAKARGRITATDTRQIKGRVGYVAPEQIMENPVDRRSDVFSLGVVLWESLALRRLFDAESEAGKLKQILDGTPLPPSAHRPEVPYELDRVCLRALAVKPDDRYQSAAEMQLALEQFLDDANFRRETGAIARFMDERFAAERQQQEALLRVAAERQPRSTSGSPVVSGGMPSEDVDTEVRTFVTEREDPFEAPTNAIPSKKAKAAAALVAAAHAKSAPAKRPTGPQSTTPGRTAIITRSALSAAKEDRAARPAPAVGDTVRDPSSVDDPAGESVTQIPVVIESRTRSRDDDTGTQTGQVVVTKPRGKRGTGGGTGKIAVPPEESPAQRHLSGRMLPLPAPSASAHEPQAIDDGLQLSIDIDDDADDMDPDVTEVDLTGNKPFETARAAAAVAAPLPVPPARSAMADDDSGMRAVEAMIHAGRRKRTGLVLGGIALALTVVVVVLVRAITSGREERPKTAAADIEPAHGPVAAAPVAEPPTPARTEPAAEPVVAPPTKEPTPEPPQARTEPPPSTELPSTRPPGEARPKARYVRQRPASVAPPASTPRRSTESPSELYTAGARLYLGGNMAEARAKFQAALQISPRYAPAHRGLGLVQERSGQTARAIQSLETYLRLAPRAADAVAIRARITRLRK